jgi:protein-S-isoprenylcysteine O-methyltransferase Ste14
MAWEMMNAEEASHWAERLWMLLGAVWLAMRFGIKQAKTHETLAEFAQHAIPVVAGFWLLLGKREHWGWLDFQFPPKVPVVWMTGLALTAVGVGLGISARLSLGRNWSGAVTLKEGHELVRQGLYRWIRHPIYAGILLGMIGTAMITGHLRGWLGFAMVWATFYYKARREESLLRQEFGSGFEAHARQTGMFLPKWF